MTSAGSRRARDFGQSAEGGTADVSKRSPEREASGVTKEHNSIRMVRILANGDIVQDDDPRVRQTTQSRGNSSRLVNGGLFSTMPSTQPNPPRHYQQQQERQGVRPGERSPFSGINQQLVNMGFPTWHLGNQVVEPVMSILLIFLLMMMGVHGLLLMGLIYVVSHLSQR